MASPAPSSPNRPPLQPKWIALILVLGLAYLVLRPFLVERFGWDLPGFTEASPRNKENSAGGTGTARKPGNRQEESARNSPIDVPTLPEQTEPVVPDADIPGNEIASNTDSSKEPNAADQSAAGNGKSGQPPQRNSKKPAKSGKDPKSDSEEEPPQQSNQPPNDRIAERSRIQPPTGKSPPDEPEPKTTPPAKGTKPATSANSGGPPNHNKSTPPAGAPKSPTANSPKLGVLTPIGNGALKSTAGLIYRQERSENRVDHVMQHSRDIPTKPVHGVYTGNRDEILALIDEAYKLAQTRGPPQVVTEEEGDRTTITVNLNRKIGFMGGENGARRGHPPLKMIKLVLEDHDVITAYPTNN